MSAFVLFLKKNWIAVAITVILATTIGFLYLVTEELREEIKEKNNTINQQSVEITTYMNSYNEQVEENSNTMKKLKQLELVHSLVVLKNKELDEELSIINADADRVETELRSLETRLTDDILLSKPEMMQRRIRAATKRAYDRLQKESDQ